MGVLPSCQASLCGCEYDEQLISDGMARHSLHDASAHRVGYSQIPGRPPVSIYAWRARMPIFRLPYRIPARQVQGLHIAHDAMEIEISSAPSPVCFLMAWFQFF